MGMRAGIAKAELQRRHAGNFEALAESMHVGRDVSEILSEKWKATQSLAQLDEQIIFGTVHPAAMNRGWFVCRNLPELGKSAEMIEADVVKIVRGPAHAVDPPRISLLLHHVPAIKRIAPALAVCTEKIRRHASDDFRIKVGAQTIQIGVGPAIGAVEIYEDRDVANDANRTLCAIGSQRLPLSEDKKLHGAAGIEIVEQLRARRLDRQRVTMSQFAGPAVPAFHTDKSASAI